MATTADSSQGENMEKTLFQKLSLGDSEGVKNILLLNEFDINCVDENGMTPLQHVCYKGNKEYVQMLLDRGADVNAGKHESSYTALHFAALSGNVEVCLMLLAAGAKSHATNSVGRTAGQMAAFVGNHSCVAVINNYVPKSAIDYYTQPHDLETEPKLLPIIASPLHKLVMQVNVNPVRVALSVQKAGALMDNIPSACKVLDLMSEKEMKKGQETNEVLSFKFHYLSFILDTMEKIKHKSSSTKKGEQDDDGANKDPVETFVRKLLQTNPSGVPEYQDKLLRECIRCFPHREGALLRQMVASLAHESSGCESALAVVAMAINGHQMGRQARPGSGGAREKEAVCEACGDWDKPCKACARCKSVLYCGKECQRLHWFVHKRVCTPAPSEASASSNSAGVAPANQPRGPEEEAKGSRENEGTEKTKGVEKTEEAGKTEDKPKTEETPKMEGKDKESCNNNNSDVAATKEKSEEPECNK